MESLAPPLSPESASWLHSPLLMVIITTFVALPLLLCAASVLLRSRAPRCSRTSRESGARASDAECERRSWRDSFCELLREGTEALRWSESSAGPPSPMRQPSRLKPKNVHLWVGRWLELRKEEAKMDEMFRSKGILYPLRKVAVSLKADVTFTINKQGELVSATRLCGACLRSQLSDGFSTVWRILGFRLEAVCEVQPDGSCNLYTRAFTPTGREIANFIQSQWYEEEADQLVFRLHDTATGIAVLTHFHRAKTRNSQ